MEAIQVQSNSNRVTVTFDRNIVEESEIISFLNWLNIEKLAKEGDFQPEVMSLSKEINKNIWNKVKKDINFKEPN